MGIYSKQWGLTIIVNYSLIHGSQPPRLPSRNGWLPFKKIESHDRDGSDTDAINIENEKSRQITKRHLGSFLN